MKKFKKGVDRRVILRYNNNTASENTKQTKDKNKKTSKKVLTNKTLRSIMTKVSLLKKSKLNQYGEVSEWFKELVLNTSDSERGRGFESHSLRQLNIFSSESIWRSTQVVEGVRLESG